jgi:hypothetical protein
MIRKTSSFNSRNEGDRSPEGKPARVADKCFEAMVRHSRKGSHPHSPSPSGDATAPTSPIEFHVRENNDLAWGAQDAAIEMFGFSADAAENRRRRRRVFSMYEEYKRALIEAQQNKRPAPTNPGWVILPRCARIILSKSAYRAFLASQLGGQG